MDSECLDLIRARRTVRRFTPQPLRPDEVEAVIEAAMYAPSRLNRQPWHFLIVEDPEVKHEIAEILRVHPYIEEAPVLVVVCGRPASSPTWLMDISAATENLLLAATALDLGSAWVAAPDTTLWSILEEHLRWRLHIPQDIRMASVVALGHAAEHPARHERAERFDPLKVHYGAWERVGASQELASGGGAARR